MTVDIIALAQLLLIGVGILAAGFTIVGAIAFWKTDKGAAKTFTLFFQRGDGLRMLTVGAIVVGVIFLALAGTIKEASVVAILSGIAGYVLGGYGRSKANAKGDEDV
jgi:hypothetical protein